MFNGQTKSFIYSIKKMIIFVFLYNMDGSVHKSLIDKVERFVRKYYANKLLHGVLFGAMLWLLLLLSLNTLEYFSWMTPAGRFILFFFLVLGSLAIGITYFIIPIVNLFRYRKTMPIEQAAVMIGRFFPEIQDKLLNTLQLAGIADSAENELLSAAIDQRSASLSPFNFSDAVSYRENIKFAVALFFMLVVAFLLAVFAPRFALQPTQRIINYNQLYEKPLPFDVTLSDTVIELTKGDDAAFSISVAGEHIPDNFIVKGAFGQQIMNRNKDNTFSFVFRNLAEDVSFRVVGGDYSSSPISIVVHPKPVLLSYSAYLVYPEYTHYDDETLDGRNHLVVPVGTRIKFLFQLRDADSFQVLLGDSLSKSCRIEHSVSEYSHLAVRSEKIGVSIANRWNPEPETVYFHVVVSPDAYPDIKVEQISDPLLPFVYYSGLLTDDYGFSRLTFNYTDSPGRKAKSVSVPFDKSGSRTSFFYNIYADSLILDEGNPVEAYFEVWDNDAFNGPKSRRSEVFVFMPPTTYILDSAANAARNAVLEKMADKAKEVENLRNEIDQLLRELVSKQELDWYDKEKLKNVFQKQNRLHEEWSELQEEQQNLTEFMKENSLSSDEMIEKQKEINKLFEDANTPDELSKIMEQIEELLEQLPRDRLQEMLQNMKSDNKQLNDLLERNMSLLEQLKTEKEIHDLIEKLENLAKDLQKDDSLGIGPDDAEKAFDKMMEDFSGIEERNKTLVEPFDIFRDEQLEKQIDHELDGASSSQQQGDQHKSQQHKNNAAQKMQQIANNLSMQLQMSAMEQMAEDAELVRQMLENTILASHRQEELMLEIGRMQKDDPQLVTKIVEQSDLIFNFNLVRDSLMAMAQRQPAIQNFVFVEIDNIETQSNLALRELNNLHLSPAAGSQQRALMSINNLSLMLAESLEQMQNSMMAMAMPMMGKESQQGNQQSQNMKSMSQKQDELGKKLKEMQQQMQKEGGRNQSNMSEQLARLAAEQEMLRQGMQQILDDMKKNGELGNGGIQQLVEEMKKLEEEIVNKNITNKTIQRNQNIISRMLESEKAMQMREKDQKRKSNEFRGTLEPRNINQLEKWQNVRKNSEFLKQLPIEYQPYYKEKINNYYLRQNPL